jgi:polyhydroxybutyrate depolymerase
VARPVSVLEIHGTSDQVVPYFGRGGRPTVDGVPPFVNGWVKRDACRSAQSPRRLAVRTTLYRWTACAGGVSVEHIQIQAGRHQWPGATPPDPGPPATICTACTVWSFFSGLGGGQRSFPPTGGAARESTR